MPSLEQGSRTEQGDEIALAILAAPCQENPCRDIATPAPQESAIISDPGISRSSLIKSRVQLSATLVALFVSL
jgi:hypothetical protein